MYYGIDPLYWILMLPVLFLSMIASLNVKSAIDKYSKIKSQTGYKAYEIARVILDQNGLSDVNVEVSKGFLSDHYDPYKKVVRLSPDVYNSTSIAAIGIAAHETGHAIQHAENYKPLVLRNLIAPTASIGSNFSWIIIVLGFIIGWMGLVKFGIILFSIVVLFQLITLPVEFNASKRAQQILYENNIVDLVELKGIKKVLQAAAMTYVAAAASAIMTLLYFLIRAGFLNRRD